MERPRFTIIHICAYKNVQIPLEGDICSALWLDFETQNFREEGTSQITQKTPSVTH